MRAEWVPTGGKYLAAAVLARTADAAAAVALLTAALGSAPAGDRTVLGGVLAAVIALPHLGGPVLAQPLARARDPRRVISGACVLFGVALAGAGGALTEGWYPIAVAATAIAGCCGPLLTGGLSQYAIPVDETSTAGRRRCESWDSATYGIAAVIGPSMVAALTLLGGTVSTFVLLPAATVTAAWLVRQLPRDRVRPAASDAPPMPARLVVRTLLEVSPLRRALIATTGAALGTGGLTVIAVVLGGRLSGDPAGGAVLAATFGAGNLVGSVLLIIRPVRGEPLRATMRGLVIEGAFVAGAGACPTFGVAVAVFFAVGVVAAAQFAASLAVRSTYSPPAIRSHVYVTMAGVKVAAGSLGAALAGLLVGVSPRVALVASGVVIVAAATAASVGGSGRLRVAGADSEARSPDHSAATDERHPVSR